MSTPPLYLIPGLGADYRVFAGLKDQGLDFQVLEFIEPKKKESLREYALRLAEGIDTSQPFMLGGMSLGGIMATEIAKVHRPEMMIMLSSVPSSREIPFYFRMFRYLPIQRLMSGKFMKAVTPRSRPDDPAVKQSLRDQRIDADPAFIKWAVEAVVYWRNREIPDPMIRIHGTRDLMFPGILCGPRTKIPKGTHVMILANPGIVYQELIRQLQLEPKNFVS